MQEGQLAVEWRATDAITPYEGNPRKISKEAVEKVAKSIKSFGWRQPIVVDGAGIIVVGHTRWQAAKHLALEKVPVHVAADLSAAEARAYRLADNRVGEITKWDSLKLGMEVAALSGLGIPFDRLRFSSAEMAKFAPNHGGDKGDLLDLVNISIGEPAHKVATGDHYRLGRHHLFVCSVMTDWRTWLPYLVEGSIFCPYPGPFAAYGVTAAESILILVQPDHYTAGHVIDRYAEVHGEDAVRKA